MKHKFFSCNAWRTASALPTHSFPLRRYEARLSPAKISLASAAIASSSGVTGSLNARFAPGMAATILSQLSCCRLRIDSVSKMSLMPMSLFFFGYTVLRDSAETTTARRTIAMRQPATVPTKNSFTERLPFATPAPGKTPAPASIQPAIAVGVRLISVQTFTELPPFSYPVSWCC